MDIRLHYTESGAGEPLVLLHGNGECGEYFRAQIEYFSRSHRVIAVDTRGHGKSPRGTGPFTLKRFACDLIDFFDMLELDRADILGYSDGGNIALLFALSAPDRVRSLILNGANLSPLGVNPIYQIPIVLSYVRACIAAIFDKKAVAARDMLALMVREPQIKPERLAAISIPVLVVAGTHDMILRRHTRKIAESIPGASLAIIEGGHDVASKNSAAFNAAVNDFLDRIDQS